MNYERIEREIEGFHRAETVSEVRNIRKSLRLLLDVARALDEAKIEFIGTRADKLNKALTALKEHCDD